jgi:hypothetical protein
MIPDWLHSTAIASLIIGAACAAVVLIDIAAGHRQKMWIMDIVWPITQLYAGPLGLAAYFWFGRQSPSRKREMASSGGQDEHKQEQKPFWQIVAVAATHCGSGCTLGDIAAGWLTFAFPLVLWGEKIFGEWVVAYAFAYAFGIAFQYFTIAPMRGLGLARGLVAAVKADTSSLTAWQVGMYGWMAIVHFGIVGEIPKTSPVFWFMMQIAMLAGFLTSYPVNWWLVKAGIKEKM